MTYSSNDCTIDPWNESTGALNGSEIDVWDWTCGTSSESADRGTTRAYYSSKRCQKNLHATAPPHRTWRAWTITKKPRL
jgi:hypothetical protein